MSNVKIHNFSNKLSTTYPRFGDKLIIAGGKHVNTHITRCTPGTDTKNTTGCVREGWTGRAGEAEIRRAAGEMLRKISFVYRKKKCRARNTGRRNL